MTKWLFTSDFSNKSDAEAIINLGFVTHILLRMEDKDIVLFTADRDTPHTLLFETEDACREAFETVSQMVKDM